jgi:hypothetical protein
LHHLYRQRHEQLTYIYAPLDPDRDCMLPSVPTAQYRDRLCDELFERTADALTRANYRQLTGEEIEQAIRATSQWGVRTRIELDALSHLSVYARGSVIGRRRIRRWQNWFREEAVRVPLYQRIVVQFRTTARLRSTQFDSRRVYFRMFKNVPQQDIDMLLPATGIHMSWLDHSKIVVPSLYAVAMTLWRVLRNVVILTLFGVFKTLGLILLVLFAIGFGIKSMFTYRSNTKRRYLLNMTQNLYYQNLDNNAGVLLRLLEEGEQQEAGEAILAYFVLAFLIAEDGRASLAQVDQACENVLLEVTGLHVNFDIEGTMQNLLQLNIVNSEVDASGTLWRAVPLDQAISNLDTIWDNWFSGPDRRAAE